MKKKKLKKILKKEGLYFKGMSKSEMKSIVKNNGLIKNKSLLINPISPISPIFKNS